MTGLMNAILVGAALSLLSGLFALALASWQTRRGHAGAGLWRTARWAALAPLLLAPVIYFIPDTSVAPMHGVLPDGPMIGAGAAGTAAANTSGPMDVFKAVEWRSVLAGLYLAGLLTALIGSALRHAHRARLVAGSRAAPDIAQDYLSMLASRIGVEAPDFRLREGLASPVLTGWTPVILASPALLDDTAASRYALTHELVHYRRGDEQDRLLGAALVAVLWFHWPLRRIEGELHEAREIDCDAESLEALGGAERKPYAATLITMMRSPSQLVSAFGPDDRRHREMRIKAIMSGRSARPSSRLLAVMLAGVSILPVACAQAALTDRTPLAVDLHNPGENHVVRWRSAPNADGDIHAEDDRHVVHRADTAHQDGLSDDADSHRVFRTEDGREQVFLARLDGGDDADASVMFIPEDGEGDVVILEDDDGNRGRYALVNEVGNVTRFQAEPGSVWQSADGDEMDLVFPPSPPAAPAPQSHVEPSAEPAPVSPVIEPGPDSKPAAAPHALRRVQPAAPPRFPQPVTEGRVTSHFGHRPARPAGAPVSHGGTDIAAATGTPVWAPGDGAVIHAAMGFNGSDRWGNTVVIQHPDGWQTIYAHLDRIDVEVGDVLQAGNQLGTVGSTGASTGPHVHVELRWNGERVDPATRLSGLR